MTAIFISHSSADNAAATEMKVWLEAQGHTSLFLDFDPELGIKGGSGWEQTLYYNLRQCQAVIALLTPDWLASKWCFAELVQARERGKAIFPVKVLPCEAGGVFSDIQNIDLTIQPEEGYRRLRIGLLERGFDPQDVFDWNPKRPPYPGLMAFQEQDAAIYFGRGEDILKMLETLDALRLQGREAARFVLMLGASGSGKSSLARAGMIPRLKKKPADWLPIPPFRPQLEPLDELAMALATAFEAQGKPRDWSAIRADLHTAAAQDPVDGLALLNLARDLAIAAQQPETTVLLTIDQAEELFGYAPSEAATSFLRLLRAALETADRRLMAIATLRSDYLGDFQNQHVLQDSEYPHHFRYRSVPVDPMPLRNFPSIIQGPARLAGVKLDDSLVETIVQDTGTRDALPLLAFTLRRLYERYGGDGRLTVDEYESLGRLEGAIREEAQRVIAEADPAPEELDALHGAFVPTMVRINAEGGYARRRARFDDLPRRALPLLRRFVDARLLVTDRDSQNRETIEVAHEALLRTWPLLGGWLAEDQDKLRLLESIQRSAEEWDQGGRHDDLLIHRNGRLKDAEALLANPRFTLSEASVERAYLDACSAAQLAREAAEKGEQERRRQMELEAARNLAAEQQKRAEVEAQARREAENSAKGLRAGRRKLLWALAGVVLVALVAVGMFFMAMQSEQQAKDSAMRANALRLVGEAQAMLSGARSRGDERALLQLVAAHRILLGAETESGLLSGLLHLRNLFKLVPTGATVSTVAFSPDGSRIVSGGGPDSTLRLWDASTGQPIGTPLEGHKKPVTSVAFSPDGRRIVSGSDDNSLRLWDASTGQPIGTPLEGHKNWVGSVAFSPDGSRIVSGSGDNTLRLWDAKTGHAIGAPLEGHKKPVTSVAFSPDGSCIVSGSGDNTLRLWDAKTGQAIQVIGAPLEGLQAVLEHGVGSVVFSPDGRRIVSGSNDTLRLWDAETGLPIGAPLEAHESGAYYVALSPDGSRMVSAGGSLELKDDTLRLWDAKTGQLIGAPLRGHTNAVNSIAFNPDGSRIVSGSNDNTLRVWDAGTPKPIDGPLEGQSVYHIAFSSDGSRIVSSGYDYTLRLWDAKTGQPIGRPLEGHKALVEALAFSPDGGRLVSGSLDGILRLWDVKTGQPIGVPLERHERAVWSVAFSPDGGRLVSGSLDGTLRLWDANTGQPIGVPLKGHTEGVTSIAFNLDGSRIVSGSQDKTLRVWDAETGQPIGSPLEGHQTSVGSLAFSPDGSVIISVDNSTLRLWNVKTGQPIGTPFEGHERAVSTVVFSPDGSHIVSGSDDKTLRVWDVSTGKPIGPPLEGHKSEVISVSFSSDGRRIISGSKDGALLVWSAPKVWAEELCAKLTRNMSHKEWREWVSPDIEYAEQCPGLPIPPEPLNNASNRASDQKTKK